MDSTPSADPGQPVVSPHDIARTGAHRRGTLAVDDPAGVGMRRRRWSHRCRRTGAGRAPTRRCPCWLEADTVAEMTRFRALIDATADRT